MNRMMVALELTNRCNFRCSYCPHSVYGEPTGRNVYDRPEGDMPRETLEAILPNLNPHAKSVTIGFFGEPLLHPNFEEFTDRLHVGRKYAFHLNTNGSLITESLLPTLWKYDTVRISLDAADKETWERLCPGGRVKAMDGTWGADRWETLTEKVTALLGVRGRPPIYLIFVTTEETKSTADRFVEQWQPLLSRKGDKIAIKTMLSYGGVMENPIIINRRCKVSGEKRLVISWQGECSPCNLDVNMGLYVGNILQTKTFAGVLGSPAYQERMHQIHHRVGLCANCRDGGNFTFRLVFRNHDPIRRPC